MYCARGVDGIWRVPTNGDKAAQVPELAKVVVSRHFTVTQRGIYYLQSEKAPWSIRLFQFATRQDTPVIRLDRPPVFLSPSLSISPDHRWLLYSQLDQSGSDIVMIEGAS